MWPKIVNLYNTNALFHSFVQGAISAMIVAFSTYSGGVPTSKAGWYAAGAFFVKGFISFATRWAQQNVATKSIPMTK